MKKSVALVLSSGGAKGLAHIGAINELEKQGFKITSVAGSSIGAFVGGLYAMKKLSEYTTWAKTLNKRSVWGLMDLTVSPNGLLKGERVFKKMKTFIPDMQINKMDIPYVAVATDILNEKEVIFDTGSFYEAVRASVAIPTLFTPVKYKDTILIDGGVLNPVPIEHVKRTEDDILVVVNLYGETNNSNKNEANSIDVNKKSLNSHKLHALIKNISKVISSGDKQSMSYFSLLSATTSAMVHRLAKQNIENHKPDIVINIPHDTSNSFDFYKANELIKIGEDAANKEIVKYLNSNKK